MAIINRDAQKEAQRIVTIEDHINKMKQNSTIMKEALEDFKMVSSQKGNLKVAFEAVTEGIESDLKMMNEELAILNKKKAELIKDEGENIFAGLKPEDVGSASVGESSGVFVL